LNLGLLQADQGEEPCSKPSDLGFDPSRIGRERGASVEGGIVGHDVVLAGPQAFQRPRGDLPGRGLGRFYPRRHVGVDEANINPDHMVPCGFNWIRTASVRASAACLEAQ
jgi:hypothetical protein